MVSLAETHLKLLFSADTEERELQGFTLVQLLLVSTAIEPCFMDTSLLQTVFLTSLGKVTPHIFSKFNPLDTDALVLQTLFNWLSQCLFWWGLTLTRIICFAICERKEKKVSNQYCKHGFTSGVVTGFAWKYYGSTVLCEQCQSVQSNFSPGWKFDWYPVNVPLLISKFHWPDINHCWKPYYSSLIC